MIRRAAAWIALSLALVACDSKKPPAPVTSAAPAPPAPPPLPPPTAPKAVTFAAADGAALAGDLYVPDDRTAPLVILVHSFRADRTEFAPLAQRLVSGARRPVVMTLDLRGHGASKAESAPKPKVDAKRPKAPAARPGPKKATVLDWTVMGPADAPDFVEDVLAAARHGFDATNEGPRAMVLVGSSLSAAVVAKAAASLPKVSGVALVSPGAAILGFDVYQPFADVRQLRSFLAAATDDNVSREPMSALTQMAKQGTVKQYGGSAHSARHLGAEHPSLWDDLAVWIDGFWEVPVAADAAAGGPRVDEVPPGAQGVSAPPVPSGGR